MIKIPKIFIACILLLLMTKNVQAGGLEKAFEALKIHDYFKAKTIFYKTLKKDSAASAYGLSIIYSRNNNPFYNLDSALLYAKLSVSTFFNNTSEKQKIKYNLLYIDTVSIYKHRNEVDEKCFAYARKVNTINSYNYFIKKNSSALKLNEAIENRNQLAYQEAKKINSSEAYLSFMNTYPKAKQFDEVNARYQKRLFEEYTADKSLESNVKFIKEHPTNFYVTQAQKNIYKLATQNKTLKAYSDFIKNYPNNPSITRAWRNVYNISTRVNTSKNIKNFLINYPNYPFKEELEQDFILANMVYYPIKKNNKWGFVNEDLKTVIKPIYSWISDFYEGAAVAELKGKYGFINKKGINLIPFEYDEAEPFVNGLSVVGKKDKYGIINRTGEIIVPLMYDDIGATNNKFISVELDGKYGFIDRKGDLTVGLKYETVGDFNYGMTYVKQNGLFGIIDTNLMYVVKPKYQWIDNLQNSFIRVQEDGLYGAINKMGDYVVTPVYNQLTEIENGYALAVKDGVYGYLNEKGEMKIDISLPYSEGVVNWGLFNDSGFARVIVEGNFGLIDTLGKRFVPALFEDVGTVSSDLIAIKRHGKWGYCDYNTKLKIPYNFNSVTPFINGLAIVQFDNNFGIINKKGSYLIEPKYEELKWMKWNVLFKKEGLYGIMTLDKEEVLPNKYHKIEFSEDGKFLILHTASGFSYKLVKSVFGR